MMYSGTIIPCEYLKCLFDFSNENEYDGAYFTSLDWAKKWLDY